MKIKYYESRSYDIALVPAQCIAAWQVHLVHNLMHMNTNLNGVLCYVQRPSAFHHAPTKTAQCAVPNRGSWMILACPWTLQTVYLVSTNIQHAVTLFSARQRTSSEAASCSDALCKDQGRRHKVNVAPVSAKIEITSSAITISFFP
ncbi:hypothetical protein RvY_17804 [Ramazzottius varieornatus]|uniref:Uncharacterized protein n=1 Tax=Ramazzottius varieornatus TaxID=947166 RepID=A0A1D1W5G9_RAMVA|nr:hypothetical protein RvY_17804 [Ramazzottius varieornatus]